MKFEDMNQKLREKASKCKTAEERKAFLKEHSIEVDDEQLEAVSGGDGRWFLPDEWDIKVCDACQIYTTWDDLDACPLCNHGFRIIKAKNLPDSYDNLALIVLSN